MADATNSILVLYGCAVDDWTNTDYLYQAHGTIKPRRPEGCLTRRDVLEFLRTHAHASSGASSGSRRAAAEVLEALEGVEFSVRARHGSASVCLVGVGHCAHILADRVCAISEFETAFLRAMARRANMGLADNGRAWITIGRHFPRTDTELPKQYVIQFRAPTVYRKPDRLETIRLRTYAKRLARAIDVVRVELGLRSAESGDSVVTWYLSSDSDGFDVSELFETRGIGLSCDDFARACSIALRGVTATGSVLSAEEHCFVILACIPSWFVAPLLATTSRALAHMLEDRDEGERLSPSELPALGVWALSADGQSLVAEDSAASVLKRQHTDLLNSVLSAYRMEHNDELLARATGSNAVVLVARQRGERRGPAVDVEVCNVEERELEDFVDALDDTPHLFLLPRRPSDVLLTCDMHEWPGDSAYPRRLFVDGTMRSDTLASESYTILHSPPTQPGNPDTYYNVNVADDKNLSLIFDTGSEYNIMALSVITRHNAAAQDGGSVPITFSDGLTIKLMFRAASPDDIRKFRRTRLASNQDTVVHECFAGLVGLSFMTRAKSLIKLDFAKNPNTFTIEPGKAKAGPADA